MERSLRVQEGLGTIGAKVQESLAGIHVVKAHTLEDHEAQRFRALNDRYNEQGLALARTARSDDADDSRRRRPARP